MLTLMLMMLMLTVMLTVLHSLVDGKLAWLEIENRRTIHVSVPGQSGLDSNDCES